jgi:homoserine O-acetyltransferase
MKPTASGRLSGYVFLFLVLCSGLADAYETPVEKKVFTIASFTTASGVVLKDVRFGYETYGHLDANKSNAILILPYFAGTGHAAGKFADADQAPGYWDSIIGSGKPLDTDRFFIIAGDNQPGSQGWSHNNHRPRIR